MFAWLIDLGGALGMTYPKNAGVEHQLLAAQGPVCSRMIRVDLAFETSALERVLLEVVDGEIHYLDL